MNRSDEVVNEYRGFLLDVCTAHNYHTKFALEQLVSCFSHSKYTIFFTRDVSVIIISFTFAVDTAVYNRVNGMPSEEEERGFQHVHTTLEALLKAIPL